MCSLKIDSKSAKVSFEDALTMTGYGRVNVIILLLACGVIIAMSFEISSVGFLVPASACELKTTSAQQGVMAGMTLLGFLTGSNIWGYLADTQGRRKILMISLTLGFFASSSITFSPNWIVFSAFKLISSTAMSGTYGLSISYLSECIPERKRNMLIIWTTAVFLAASGFLAAITIPILPLKFAYYIPYLGIYFNSWRFLNIIFSVPCALAVIAMYFGFESPKYLLSVGKEQEALHVLRRFFVINNGLPAEEYKVQHLTLNEDNKPPKSGFWFSITSQVTPLFKPPLLQKTLMLSVLFISVYFCQNPFQVWLPFTVDILMKSTEKGETGKTLCEMIRTSLNETTYDKPSDCALNKTAMLIVCCMMLFLAVCNIVLSGLLPYVGRKKLLISLQMLAGIAGLCIVWCRVWQLTAVLMIVYYAGIINLGYLSTYSVDLYPTYVKAMGVCLTLMIGRVCAVIGVNLLKNLITYHCETAFYLFPSITLIGGIGGILLPNDKKKEDKSEA